jgi:hypothetical protein
MLTVEELKQYASNIRSNEINNKTIEFNSVNYFVVDIVTNGALKALYLEALLEESSDVRHIILPGEQFPVEIRNSQLVTLMRNGASRYQQTLDVYYEVIAQIEQLSLTTEVQVDNAWTLYTSQYINTRDLSLSNEDLGLAIDALSGVMSELENALNVKQAVITPGSPIDTRYSSASTDAPTNLNTLNTVLGTLVGEVNDGNALYNDLASKHNELGTLFRELVSTLESQGLLQA